MNGKFKVIAGTILTVFALFGAVWGLNDQFTPREVHELWVADMQKQMIQIQKNNQVAAAQNQLWYWQAQVERLTGEVARAPSNQFKKNQLTEAKKQQTFWQREVHKLMNQ